MSKNNKKNVELVTENFYYCKDISDSLHEIILPFNPFTYISDNFIVAETVVMLKDINDTYELDSTFYNFKSLKVLDLNNTDAVTKYIYLDINMTNYII